MATFPLECIICSEEHKYSDVSHLLTHMSSKRHLAAEFKATVRARQDPVLGQKLHEFYQWYEQNNLTDLLAERLAKKDEKKLEAKAIIKKNGGQRNRKRGKKADIIKDDPQKQYKNTLLGTGYYTPSIPIDPDVLVKEEPGLHTEGHNVPYCTCSEQQPTGEQVHNNLRIPGQSICQQCWPSLDSSLDNLVVSSYRDEYSWIPELSEPYGDEDSPYGRHSKLEPVNNSSSHNDQGMASIQERVNNSSEDGEGEDDEDCPAIPAKEKTSKLKGIIWPGMYLFDAASPEGIRMRNQRKKFEISGILERSSQQTQPIEMIHYAETWTVKEDRVIDGEVHSPPPEDLPPPVKRQRRRVLAEKSVNKIIGRTDRRKGSYRGSQKLTEVENRSVSYTPHPIDKLAFIHEQHNTGTLLADRGFYGSPVKLEPRHDQFGSHELTLQSTAYPFITNYGFSCTGSESGKITINDQDSSDFPYYLAPISALPGTSDLHRPTLARRNIDSRSPSLRHISDELHTKGLSGLNDIPIATQNTQRLPSIDTFDRFLSIPYREGIDRQSTYSQDTTRYQLAELQSYGQNQVVQDNNTVSLRTNEPKTPIKTNDYDNYSLAYHGMYEDSSGDETIDQGIDDTPTRYLTRSAVHTLRDDLS